MTPDQVSGFFDAGESFVEGTIAAALVALWLLALALHLARPYMVANLRKFTLRLGADLWWIVYVALRDILLVQVFLGSFIFFYPDVVGAQDLPITGGLAAVCAFAVLLMKLVSPGDADLRWYRLADPAARPGRDAVRRALPPRACSSPRSTTRRCERSWRRSWSAPRTRTVALPLCYLSAALVGILGLVAVIYNLRRARRTDRRRSRCQESAAERATTSPTRSSTAGPGWLVLSLAAVLPMLWAFTLILHFARPYVLRFLGTLTLRFGGDVWWLSYVLMRDALLLVTLTLSIVFLMPNLYIGLGLPLTAPLATVILMWALVVKLLRDADDDPQAFTIVSVLMVVASVLYIVPQIYGLESADQVDPLNGVGLGRDPGCALRGHRRGHGERAGLADPGPQPGALRA